MKSTKQIAEDYGIEFHGNHFVGTVEFSSVDEFIEMCMKVAYCNRAKGGVIKKGKSYQMNEHLNHP